MGRNPFLAEQFEIVAGHAQRCITHPFQGPHQAVGPGIDLPILAGNIVLHFEQIIAVIQLEYALGLTFIYMLQMDASLFIIISTLKLTLNFIYKVYPNIYRFYLKPRTLGKSMLGFLV